jgi:CRP/FNR family transcriptional regulator, cyclic AMP receptor protein
MAEEQEHIALLLSANSEQRLANMLLHLGGLFGTNDSHSRTTIPRILLDDLASMVGTTRSRVGFFLKNFREQGLVEVNADRSLTFQPEKLREFAMAKRADTQFAKGGSYRNGLSPVWSSAGFRSQRTVDSKL